MLDVTDQDRRLMTVDQTSADMTAAIALYTDHRSRTFWDALYAAGRAAFA